MGGNKLQPILKLGNSVLCLVVSMHWYCKKLRLLGFKIGAVEEFLSLISHTQPRKHLCIMSEMLLLSFRI